MKRAYSLILLGASLALAPAYSQTPPLTLYPGVTDAHACQVLASVIPFASACEPHVMLVAYAPGLPAGSAVRFTVTYLDKTSGQVVTAEGVANVQHDSAVWVLQIVHDFVFQRATATSLAASGTIETLP